MAADERTAAITTFFYAWFGVTLAVFPLVATVEARAFGGRFGSLAVLVASVVAALPAALEFAFTGRNVRRVWEYVVAFVVLYFLAILGQAGVYVVLGRTQTVVAFEIVVLFATYAVAYWLVYRVGVDRLRGAVAG